MPLPQRITVRISGQRSSRGEIMMHPGWCPAWQIACSQATHSLRRSMADAGVLMEADHVAGLNSSCGRGSAGSRESGADPLACTAAGGAAACGGIVQDRIRTEFEAQHQQQRHPSRGCPACLRLVLAGAPQAFPPCVMSPMQQLRACALVWELGWQYFRSTKLRRAVSSKGDQHAISVVCDSQFARGRLGMRWGR